METNSGWKFRRAVRMFKSYYVVWKPDNKMENKMSVDEFKSYYVVWKLKIIARKILSGIQSLNRTMQYGNRMNGEPFFGKGMV